MHRSTSWTSMWRWTTWKNCRACTCASLSCCCVPRTASNVCLKCRGQTLVSGKKKPVVKLLTPALILLVAAAVHASTVLAATAHSHASQGGTTTWHLNRSVLDALGIHVGATKAMMAVPPSAKRSSYSELKFAALDTSAFRFRESQGLPRALTGGALRHAGGFVLDFPGGHVDLRGFALRPSSRAAFALDVVDADSHVWFTLDQGHYQLEDANRTFAMRYMNLRIS